MFQQIVFIYKCQITNKKKKKRKDIQTINIIFLKLKFLYIHEYI